MRATRRPILLFAALALLAVLLFAPAPQAQVGTLVPALEVTSADVSTTGNTDPLDAGDNGSCAAVAELTALSGGSSPQVVFKVQTSSNSSTWYDVTSHAACTGTCTKTEYTLRTYMRYLRLTWTTTGTPSTATAHLFINCFR